MSLRSSDGPGPRLHADEAGAENPSGPDSPAPLRVSAALTAKHHRDEQRSVIVTTNLAFAEWVKVFGGDEKLTTALLDRLAHHATVIATKGKSFRTRKKGATEPTSDHEATSAALPKTGRKA